MTNSSKINRRDFLKISSLASGGLLISFTVFHKTNAAILTKKVTANERLNAFLRIDKANNIFITLSKVEMGQGISTTLPMLIAEELDCDWAKIKVEHSPSGNGDDFKQSIFSKTTGGSDTTRSQFTTFRQAGATARVLLVNAAAIRFGTKAENCKTENGYVLFDDKRLSYGELANEASLLPIPAVKLRDPQHWKYIGTSHKRLDAADKINGAARYGLDIQFAGLLTSVVAHSPVFGGTVKSFDATKAKAVKGVRDVVKISTGIAVIADNFWAARTGRDELKVEWDYGVNRDFNSLRQLEAYRVLSKTRGIVIQEKGEVNHALKLADKVIDTEFSVPYLAHAPMEPLNCTVKINEHNCEVWASTQAPLLRQEEIADFLGFKPEQVKFNTPLMGGSFGRRGSFKSDWVMEAVEIAKKSGQTIKLVWSREDDIKGGYYRPFYLHSVQVGIDRNGLPVAWRHRIVGQSLFVNTPLEQEIVQNGIDYSSVTTAAPYSDSIKDYSFELHTTTVGVPVLPWRSVGNSHTAFVIEVLIDELANIAGKDPVKYRRLLLKNSPRHLGALNLAAEKSNWDSPLPVGMFRGIAVHEAMGSFVSQVIEISVRNKVIRVERVICAIDCGLAVNPDGVRAQMEGGIVFGLTAALYGEISLEKGEVKQSNFNDYRMVRINESPRIEVYIAPGTSEMGGAGEPGVPPIAPALSNALFAATGVRQRTLPLKLKL